MAIKNRHNQSSTGFGVGDAIFRVKSKEEQIAWICAIIQREVEKEDGEVDEDLVLECTEFLEELTSDEKIYTEEELEQKLQKIKEEASAEQNDFGTILPCSGEPLYKNPKKKRRALFKVVAAIAATFLLSFATLSVAAISQGYTISEFITVNIEKIKGMCAGDRLEEGNVTLIKNGVSAKYASVEEAIKEGGLDILYPTVLPEGVKIEQIVVTHKGDESDYRITFATNTESFRYVINSIPQVNEDDRNDLDIYETNGMEYYIKATDNRYQATGYYEGFEYSVLCETYDELIKILNGMKGLEI